MSLKKIHPEGEGVFLFLNVLSLALYSFFYISCAAAQYIFSHCFFPMKHRSGDSGAEWPSTLCFFFLLFPSLLVN